MSTLFDKVGAFTTVPNSIIRLWPAIGGDAFDLWVYLRYRTNSQSEVAFPGYDTIRAETTIGRNRIARAIRALEKHDLLERRKRFGATTIYSIKAPLPPQSSQIGTNGDAASNPAAGLKKSRGGTPVVPKRASNKNENNKTDSNKTEISAAPPAHRVPDPLFDAIVSVCGIDLTLDGSGKSVGKVASILKKADPPYSPADVYAWGKQQAWRSSPPTVWQLKSGIGAIHQKGRINGSAKHGNPAANGGSGSAGEGGGDDSNAPLADRIANRLSR